ncbi:MAG: hypothetical protein K2L37_07300 [Lactobacillus sp.]|nr:hypothetical protein [Lactobacillus sp.]
MTKARYYLAGNLFIQLFWIALSITLAIYFANKWVPNNGTIIVAGALTVVFYGTFNFLGNIFDAWRNSLKDPDLQTAGKLNMSVKNYRMYRKLYDAHWEVMMKYGPNSSEAEKFFAKEVYPYLPNLNEWRKYGEYRGWLQRKEQEEIIRRMFSNKS